MQIEVNIGLNVNGIFNPTQEEDIVEILGGNLIRYRINISNDGYNEPTFVGIIIINLSDIIKFIENLCILLDQKYIAVRYRPVNSINHGLLIANPFLNGVKEKYNDDYFISFTDCAKLPDNMGFSMSSQKD